MKWKDILTRNDIGTNVALINSLFPVARIPLVSTNIERARNIYMARSSETEIITVKIPTALASKIQIH